MSKADVLVNISKKYYKEVKQRILLAEEDREYGRYKKYGGKIKFKMYLARLYGMNEVCEALMEVLEDE